MGGSPALEQHLVDVAGGAQVKRHPLVGRDVPQTSADVADGGCSQLAVRGRVLRRDGVPDEYLTPTGGNHAASPALWRAASASSASVLSVLIFRRACADFSDSRRKCALRRWAALIGSPPAASRNLFSNAARAGAVRAVR